MLIKNKKKIQLHIIRPSIIVCSHKYPYKGYGALQNINLFLFGTITGTLAYIDLYENQKINCIIPVDKVANMCVSKLKRKKKLSITHCSYNNNFWNVSKLRTYMKYIHNSYKINPININSYYYKPYSPIFTNNNFFYKIYSIIYFIVVKLLQGMSISNI